MRLHLGPCRATHHPDDGRAGYGFYLRDGNQDELILIWFTSESEAERARAELSSGEIILGRPMKDSPAVVPPLSSV